PGFSQNNFGATFGGPLVRDRAFLFASYEGFRQRQQVSVLNNVPSPNTIAAVKRQNALLGAIFDAYYSGPAAAQPGTFTDLPVDAILARGVPVVGTAVLPRGNGVDQDAGLIRFDQNLARGWSLNARYQVFQATGIPGTISGRGIAGSNIGYENRSQNAMLAVTKIVSARTLLDARTVFQRNTPRSTMEATPQALRDAGRLRTSGPNAGQPYGDPETPNGVPTISTVGFDLAPIGYETTAPNRRAANTLQYAGNVTHARGAHTLKFGGELRRIQENSVFSFRLRPEITYASGGASSILLPGAPFNVYDQNIFLLPPTSQRGFRLTEWAGYVQDTWRVLPRLTVDVGVRYESFGVPSEVNGILNNGFLVPGSIVLANADVLAQGPRALRDFRMIATGAGRPYSFYRPDRNNFAPRVGLAWQLRPRTALRLGYGFFYDRMFNNVFGNARNNPPYTLLVTLPNAPFGAIPAADPFTTTLPIGPVTINPVIRSPYTQRFNATLQREFAGFLAEAGYAGARAQRLVRTLRPNQGAGFPADFRPANIDVPERPRTLDDFRPLVYGNISTRDGTGASTYHALQASLQRRFARGLFAQASYTWGRSMDIASGEILNDVVVTTISNRMPLRTADGLVPMPSLANVNQVRAQQGAAPFTNVRDAARWYNDNFLGPEQWGAEIGNSAFDIRQIFVANVGWEIPWAKQRWYGGWQVAGIVRLQTGVPFSLSTGIDVNGDGNAPDRAALLAGDLKSLVAPEGRRFLLPSAPGRGVNNQSVRTFTNGAVVGVSATPDDVFSYTRRGALHGPALRLVDFSVLKNFAVTERARLQFRAEAFNILNAVNYGLPVANVASPRFGEMLTTAAPPRQIQMGLRVEF
ncbi:MAG: TonB-dependent receptor, partial [Bryobacter sp.]|nr:TonB-dependent receptor [Bryobacter sp.]